MMVYFDDENNVRNYEQMAEAPGGALLVSVLQEHLPMGRRVLEIGMGPGRDLDRLLSAGYVAAGSDHAVLFLDRYRARGGKGECLVLDAETLATDRLFDAVFSNKVLHHLHAEQLVESLGRQSDLVGPGGLLLHSFWRGDRTETHHGLLFTYWELETIEGLLPVSLTVRSAGRYGDIWDEDSFWVLLEVGSDQADCRPTRSD